MIAVVIDSLRPGVSFALPIHDLSARRTNPVKFRVMHCCSPLNVCVYGSAVDQ